MTRALLDEARRHDAAMHREVPACNCKDRNFTEVFEVHPDGDCPVRRHQDAVLGAEVWVDANLHALLDAHEHALGEVNALKSELEASECGHDSYAHLAARQNTELLRLRAAITALHTDAEHWLTEPNLERPNLRAAENRLAAILKGTP